MAQRRSPVDGLLHGVRVVDLSRILAGPFAAQALAGLGADVLKVESPDGDPARGLGPFQGDQSLYFAALNTGKRGVVLDLHRSTDRRVLDALLAETDIVIENMMPATARKLGCAPDRLLRDHPQLVIVSISGYARGTSRQDEPALDLTVQASTGIMSVTGEPGRPPVRAGVPVGDLAAGLWAALAAVSGYAARLRDGNGRLLEVPLVDATYSMLSYVATAAAATGKEPEPIGSGHHTAVPYGAFPTKDGWIAIAVLTESSWSALVAALRLENAGIEKLRTNAARQLKRDEVTGQVAVALRTLTTGAAERLLTAAGVPNAPVRGVLDALGSSYAVERGIGQRRSTAAGEYLVVRNPIGDRALQLRAAPLLGEHTKEVVRALLAEQPALNHEFWATRKV